MRQNLIAETQRGQRIAEKNLRSTDRRRLSELRNTDKAGKFGRRRLAGLPARGKTLAPPSGRSLDLTEAGLSVT
jgi:hypothetical protein